MFTLDTIGVMLAAMPLILEIIETYSVKGGNQDDFEERLLERKSFAAELRQVHFSMLGSLRDVIFYNAPNLTEKQKRDLGSYDCERRKFLAT